MKDYKWCAIDAEGDVGNAGLIGVAFYADGVGDYYTDHKLIEAAIHSYAEAGYTFIAHNAEYDLSVIFWQLKIPMKAVYFSGRFNRGEWRYDKRKAMCQLWDTLSLSGGLSLYHLGKAIDVPKYPTPQRLKGVDPNRYAWTCERHQRGECEECYAIRDAEICWLFMTQLTTLLSSWGVEPHRRLAGLASHVWRALDHPEPIGIKNEPIRRLARASYHGGRTETFKLGTVGPCYSADVTSMYPAMMQNTLYPDPEHMIYVTDPSSNECLGYEGCADVEVTVPDTLYCPPLPHIVRGMLHYPVGRWRGSYTHYELRHALDCGAQIHHIYASAYSPIALSPFTQFVGALWQMREVFKKTGDPRHLFAKLLMNNLYGYLGMRDDLTRTDISMAEAGKKLSEQPKSWWYTEGGELFLTYERPQPKRNNWTNVLWAAQTTAAARVHLHRHMVAAGSSLIYCDTDSIFSMQPISGTGEGLGELADDGMFQEIIVAAPKLYALCDSGGTWHAKAKGVSRTVALKFLRDGVATFNAPIKPLSQGRRKIAAGTWVPITRHQQYSLARRQPLDASAVASEDRWTDTRPLVVARSS